MSIGTAGRICDALRRNPTAIPRRLSEPVHRATTAATNAVQRRIYGERSTTSSGPFHIIIVIKLINNSATGIVDICHDGSLGDNGNQSEYFFNAIFLNLNAYLKTMQMYEKSHIN